MVVVVAVVVVVVVFVAIKGSKSMIMRHVNQNSTDTDGVILSKQLI